MKSNITMVSTSNNRNYLFDLTRDNHLVYDLYKGSHFLKSSTLSEKISMYSIDIDDKDSIHIVALNDVGDLIYYKSVEDQWSSQKIAWFDLSSNLYNQLEIKIINDELHLLYNYSNLINSNVWTIQHIIYNGKIKKKYNAIRYLSKKYSKPFAFDVDSIGNIHLIYQSNMQNYQMHYGFYSPFANKWSYKNKKISQDNINSISPNIFVDSKDTIHLTWTEAENNYVCKKYIKMDSHGKNKYIWREMDLSFLPNLDIDSTSTIFEQENDLKFAYESNNYIYPLYSKDFGKTWKKIDDKKQSIKNLKFSPIIINRKSAPYKIKYGYISLVPSLSVLYLDIFYGMKKDDPICEVDEIEEENTKDLEVKESEKTEDDRVIDRDILDYINKVDSNIESLIAYHPYVKSSLDDILEKQKNIETKLNKLEYHLDKENKTLLHKIFGSN